MKNMGAAMKSAPQPLLRGLGGEFCAPVVALWYGACPVSARLAVRFALLSVLVFSRLRAANLASVSLTITESNRPLPCRIHLVDSTGKSVRADPLPFWRDHFVCPGNVTLALAAGEYRYEVERGPEYESLRGSFTVADGETKEVKLQLKRIADLKREGWWSGELHVHRPPQDVELLMQAEDLHAAPVITWWNNRNLWSTTPIPAELTRRFDDNRFFNVMGGEDEREGGALLFFHLAKPLDIAGASREFPSPLKFVEAARKSTESVKSDQPTNHATRSACRRRAATDSGPRRFTTACSTPAYASRRARAAPAACCRIRWATTGRMFTLTES